MFFSKRLLSARKSGLTIVSGCDRLRLKSFVNHKFFADLNDVNYVWSFMLRRDGLNPYLRKIDAVQSALGADEWLFWLDDDAYFTDFSWRLLPYVSPYSKYDLVICKSPINNGAWTYVSSGQFFLKSTRRSAAFLDAMRNTDLEQVKTWWSQEKYGMFTSGDQDVMVYVLATDPRFREGEFFVRLDYSEFNSREFHYKESADEHRLLHLASAIKTKEQLLEGFRERFDLNEFLIPEALLGGIDLEAYKKLRIS
ncbi:hypothetical protein HBIAX_03824 [Achromobacter xylosoxidans]|nr:hypothetical protein HBIAX_03824 [Achromobacter xylosoxidans]